MDDLPLRRVGRAGVPFSGDTSPNGVSRTKGTEPHA